MENIIESKHEERRSEKRKSLAYYITNTEIVRQFPWQWRYPLHTHIYTHLHIHMDMDTYIYIYY